jgi:hypothetical protein
MRWLQEHRPDLVGRYRELYRRGAYAPPQERKRLTQLLEAAQIETVANERWTYETRPDPSQQARDPPKHPRGLEQERLF